MSWVIVTLLCGGGLLPHTGCSEPAEIAQYEIETIPPAELRGEKRMLGAIVPEGNQVWFFKLIGDREEVDVVADEVYATISKTTFEGGEPRFALPESWDQKPATGMRFATIEIPSEPLPLELTVSELSKSGDWSEQVAMNVNRWRGQVGLENSDEAFAGATEIELLTFNPDEPAVWVDVTGVPKANANSMMGGPMAGGPMMGNPMMGGTAPPNANVGSNGPPGESSSGSPSGSSGDVEIDYDVPESWTAGRMSIMRKAAFNAGEGDQQAELTVIASGGDLRSNIRRWLGQIRPEGVDEAALDAVIQDGNDIEVDGIAG